MKKWRALLWDGTKQRFLGHFTADTDAARAYDRALLELKGPDAKTNFPASDYDNMPGSRAMGGEAAGFGGSVGGLDGFAAALAGAGGGVLDLANDPAGAAALAGLMLPQGPITGHAHYFTATWDQVRSEAAGQQGSRTGACWAAGQQGRRMLGTA